MRTKPARAVVRSRTVIRQGWLWPHQGSSEFDERVSERRSSAPGGGMERWKVRMDRAPKRGPVAGGHAAASKRDLLVVIGIQDQSFLEPVAYRTLSSRMGGYEPSSQERPTDGSEAWVRYEAQRVLNAASAVRSTDGHAVAVQVVGSWGLPNLPSRTSVQALVRPTTRRRWATQVRSSDRFAPPSREWDGWNEAAHCPSASPGIDATIDSPSDLRGPWPGLSPSMLPAEVCVNRGSEAKRSPPRAGTVKADSVVSPARGAGGHPPVYSIHL